MKQRPPKNRLHPKAEGHYEKRIGGNALKMVYYRTRLKDVNKNFTKERVLWM
ncbi:hypothetical protein HMPREF1987_01611 [Peptostreptococcaceae bacterium oral taxon 113 str. W5053]|nr:hypothetical protein HMPREF1987_01611 [Peptostreptococcaceae bacterium oral taxon 113 str. W5053]